MKEQHAQALADVIGGEAWKTHNNDWVVGLQSSDGRVIAISDEQVCEYADDDAFDTGSPSTTVLLDAPEDAGRLWVVVGRKGQVYFRHPDLRLGWRHREDAEEFASGCSSRDGESYMVCEQQPDGD